MSRVIALIPARAGSKGITAKNFKDLGGQPLFEHAIRCALAAGLWPVVSSDSSEWEFEGTDIENAFGWVSRPAALAQDDTPMYDVVQHAAKALQLGSNDIIVLVQPTQPFRKPEHLTRAVELLRETQADSVVSVVPLPLTHSPDMQLRINRDGLRPYRLDGLPSCRQGAEQTYMRDGTVYAFWVNTIRLWQSLYGPRCEPLILDPSESCELDTESDWAAVEARWVAQHEA